MKISIIAVGLLKDGPTLSLWNEYHKRLNWSLDLTEIDIRKISDPNAEIANLIHPHSYTIALDEQGKSLSSQAFSQKLSDVQISHNSTVQFILGPSDGLNNKIRKQSDFLLSFGKQTWPHMLARVMLIEQIYRAQQILKGHPYHK